MSNNIQIQIAKEDNSLKYLVQIEIDGENVLVKQHTTNNLGEYLRRTTSDHSDLYERLVVMLVDHIIREHMKYHIIWNVGKFHLVHKITNDKIEHLDGLVDELNNQLGYESVEVDLNPKKSEN